MNLSRRDFFQYSAGIGALMALNPWELLAKSKTSTPTRLSWLAYRTTSQEGSWTLTDIEGQIPSELQGQYFKIGPGTKDIFGHELNHFFDGDAYVSRFTFSEQRVELLAQFIQSPQRMLEQTTGQMLYHEFGTAAPSRTQKGRKNQTNINLIPWDNSILALSEGGHPAALDATTLEFKSFSNFRGTLPKDVSFSAHPKFDPISGDGYAFGIHQGFSRALKVFRMNAQTQAMEELYSLNQSKVWMIHDMAMTENHLVFLIPPVFFKLTDLVLGREPLAGALQYDARLGSRLLILDKKGEAKPVEIKLPSSVVFHHGNATLTGDVLVLQTFLAPDAAMLNLCKEWSNPNWPAATNSSLHELTVNIATGEILRNEKLLESHDFPIFNTKYAGLKSRYIYAAGAGRPEDAMGFDRITKYDFQQRSFQSMLMPASRICGEALYIPRPSAQAEDDGWLAYLGYDVDRDESFLELLDARDMTFVARIWAGLYLPQGFHGLYLPKSALPFS
jgi:all-trans-8'-apo-beta-carotenal 15,15'-oxygenase